MQQTLTEMTRAEVAKRIQARDFEEATNRVTECQRKVERLNDDPSADAVARLRTVIEAAQGLPESVIGSVGGLIPLSGVAKTFLVGLASDALKNVEGQDARRRADLVAAKAALKAAQEHLATFNE